MRVSILQNQKAVVDAAQSSVSISEALDKLGLRAAGGNFEAFKMACAKYQVDYPRFDRAKQLEEIRKKTPLEDILVENSQYRGGNQSLLKRLQKADLIENFCRECGIPPEWNGKTLVLQLDHINGDSADNRLANLQPICPNCHSQTDTYCGKKQPHRCKCGVVILRRSTKCRACSNQEMNSKREKITWPPTDTLREMVIKSNFSAVGRQLGVTDNAVRKRIKNH